MRIFVFSSVFHPSIGGIERIAEILCRQFTALGHEVIIATTTAQESNEDRFPFQVIRNPSFFDMLRLHRWCDVHLQMNVSLKYAWTRLLAGAPTIYNFQNAYIGDDGVLSFRDRLKRFTARHSHGIANSRYTAREVGCKTIVFNPYDDDTFRIEVPRSDRKGDLVFLGRLVSQKGCDTLIKALGQLRRQHDRVPTLTVIGDGPDRAMLTDLAREEGVADTVHLIGALQGEALRKELNRHRFLIVPSRYEEPFGIVALEGLACGLVPIVSERGGLVDAVGPYGLTFPNGDAVALAAVISMAIDSDAGDPDSLEGRCSVGIQQHLEGFTSKHIAQRFLEIFECARGRSR